MTCSSLPLTSKLAILVPYRNRKGYLDIFLREVPRYLERANGISDYAIYVAEQKSQDLFNLALSRNVAARAALDDGTSEYFVFHDVDVIPLCGLDYGPRSFNDELRKIGSVSWDSLKESIEDVSVIQRIQAAFDRSKRDCVFQV